MSSPHTDINVMPTISNSHGRGQVTSEALSMSLEATLGPTRRQRQLYLFLRVLTILFLCTLLHGQSDQGFITAVSEGRDRNTGFPTVRRIKGPIHQTWYTSRC